MTDALPAIPISFPLKTRLTDGTRILVRPLKPEDRNDLLKGFEKLSIASRRYRFLSPIRKLTERQLQLLLDMDNVNHVAIGVRDIGRLKKPGIAIGRMVRYEQQPEIAEFAITVIDEYQKRGIGTLLIRLLAGCTGKGHRHPAGLSSRRQYSDDQAARELRRPDPEGQGQRPAGRP